jgi:predicted PhzF superfamily epimerase YddE/YHI9
MPFHSVVLTGTSSVTGFDIGSRVFSPQVGIAEDLASTGAQCCLGAYWSKKLGKPTFRGYQGLLERYSVFHFFADQSKIHLAGNAFKTIDAFLSTTLRTEPTSP